MYSVQCSGQSRRLGRYTSFTCAYYAWNQTSAQWVCLDIYGNSWQRSR